MDFICALLSVYTVVLFGRAIMSWFPIDSGSALAPVSRILFDLTEPVLAPVRGVIQPVSMGGMGLDLSLMVVVFGIIVMRGAIC